MTTNLLDDSPIIITFDDFSNVQSIPTHAPMEAAHYLNQLKQTDKQTQTLS